MTIERESRRSDVYLGDGRNTSLPFGFKVFLPTEIAVVLNENGVERTLSHGHGCTVSLNANQDVQPGGTVQLDAPLPTGSKAVVLSNVRPLQQVDLTNQGGFYPDVLNAVHDRLTMLIQQLMELQDRTPQVPATDTVTGKELAQQIVELSRSLPGIWQLLTSDEMIRLLAILEQNPQLRPTELSSEVNSNREDMAATPKAVKAAYDKAVESAGKGLPVGAVIGFPRAITSQEGFLKADGSTFAQATYPDLHRVLGGNKLPKLTCSDVGMTAYFPIEAIPDGWIKYDEIATRVTQSSYPELYRLLVAQYGSIAAVPKAEDRFIRNAGSLTVGTTQEPLVASHAHPIGILWADNDDIMLHRLPGGGNKTSMTAGSPFAVINGESHGGSNQFGNVVQRGNGIVTENNASVITTITDQKVLSTNGDNRPSALAMVLCIKAKDSLDDVVMWIKAFGKVTNAGALDASTLAAGLQGKSDKGHTHRAADISDLGEAVKQQMAAAMQHQASTNGYTKLPNGLIDQWGEVLMGWRGEGPVKVVFPIAFASECYNVQITVKSSGRSGAVGADLTIGAGEITATGFSAMLNTWAQGAVANDFQGFLWRAIGK